MNDHLLITKADNPSASLPTGEPVAKAPQTAPETVCDPRAILVAERVESPHEVLLGDFVQAQGWSRPRRVEFIDSAESGPVLFLADPDESRTNEHGIRRLDADGWEGRGAWKRYPNLRRVWDAAHGGS